MLRPFIALFAVLLATLTAAPAMADVLVYGPGGPAPAMKEAAKAFTQETGIAVTVTAGPTGKWMDKAKSDADVIYSGSENMMTGFQRSMEGQIVPESVHPLYLRKSAILVRKGNPKGITGIGSLAQPGMRVMVVEGAGQNGLWEDIAGRSGDIGLVRALRGSIVEFAGNSGLAKQAWQADPTIDAWIIWTIWQRSNSDLADAVPVEPDLAIYRDTGVALTKRGAADPDAVKFTEWLASGKADAIFAKWGWIVPEDCG